MLPVSIVESEKLYSLVTKARDPSALMATDVGNAPTAGVAITLFEARPITDTEDPLAFVTKALAPFGVIAMLFGKSNPEMVVMRLPEVLWTVTLPEYSFVTYTDWPFGDTATLLGPEPALKELIAVLEAVSITVTVPAHKLVTKARLPSGVKATAVGRKPTGIEAISDLEAASMTEI